MTTPATTAIATMPASDISNFAIFSPDVDVSAISEAMAANMAGEDVSAFDLPRVKVPSGGGTSFEVPTIDGDVNMPNIVGIIAFVKAGRAWWEVDFDQSGGGTAPDCSSEDGVTGSKFGLCSGCQYSQFGSASKGAGQACKDTRSLFVLTPEGALPLVVSVPPTSLKPLKAYLMRLTSVGAQFSGCVTSIGLNKTQNKGGIKYSELTFFRAGVLSPEQRQRITAYAEALKDSFCKVHAAAVQNGSTYDANAAPADLPEDNPFNQGDE